MGKNIFYYKHQISLCRIFVILCICVILPAVSFSPVYSEDKNLAELAAQIKETDAALTALSEEINQLDQQVASKNSEIESLKKEIQTLTALYSAEKSDMEDRMRAMYMHDKDEALEILFSSTGLAEFISRAELIIAVYRADQSKLDELSTLQNQIQENEVKLETEKSQLQDAMNQVVEKETTMATQLTEQQTALKNAQAAAATKANNTDGNPSSFEFSETSGNATEFVNASDFDLICAIVRHEGGASYEGSLAVISCVMNRVEVGGWYGSDAVSVLTKAYQFESYFGGYYKQFLGADIPETRRAVKDCMEGGKRSHPYLSFRSTWYFKDAGYFPDGEDICGNYYFNPM